jgi:hypothetical protein
MDELQILLDLPIAVHVAALCFAVCVTCLFVMLIVAPRRNCFFFRWDPETRLLALLVAPALLIIWPVVLYNYFLRSRGVDLDDLDFYDD